ncbi:MAG TPA: single-stranded DNA-binding protein [Solirubrobacteraceae bacterium]|nr:single-stranded DNA-binding protein [Solirubrobacteraceae bacterium]
MNRYTGTGRLTRDPELRSLSSGTSVCELRLAVDGMGRNNEVGFINVNVYGASGEAAARVLSKGWKVAVDGRLEWAEWETDGAKRHDYTVVGFVEFLAEPREKDEQSEEPPVEEPAAAPASRSRRQKAAAAA